jgi:hypothetical protein
MHSFLSSTIFRIKHRYMKKRLLLLMLLSCCLFALNAQTTGSSVKPNETFFNGHTIRVFQIPENRLVVHQSKNPFTDAAVGLKTADDALKVAKWQAIQPSFGGRQMLPNRAIPKEVAHQLNIDTN